MLASRGKLNNYCDGINHSGQLPEDDFTDSLSVSPSIDVLGYYLVFCLNYGSSVCICQLVCDSSLQPLRGVHLKWHLK